jgi:hypothetical protein
VFSFQTADKREFLRISQAVGMGFLIMGVIGYIVKLSEFSFPFYPTPCSPVSSDEETERWWWSRERDFKREDRRAGTKQARYGVVVFWYGELTYLLPLTVHIPVNNILVGGA